MERVVVTRPVMGLLYMQVCAVEGATDEEILGVANSKNPAGTTNGWARVVRDGEMKPVPCEDHPGRQHLILVC